MAIGGKSFLYNFYFDSDTFTVPAGVTTLILIGHGGGAGGLKGGHALSPFAIPKSTLPVMKIINVDPNTTYTITIGAGGLGATNILNNGGNGGDTTFGSLATFKGAKGDAADYDEEAACGKSNNGVAGSNSGSKLGGLGGAGSPISCYINGNFLYGGVGGHGGNANSAGVGSAGTNPSPIWYGSAGGNGGQGSTSSNGGNGGNGSRGTLIVAWIE